MSRREPLGVCGTGANQRGQDSLFLRFTFQWGANQRGQDSLFLRFTFQ